MPSRITPEQQAALNAHAGQAVPMQDEQSHQRLKELIQEGIDSPGVPAEEAHERIRQMAREAAAKYA